MTAMSAGASVLAHGIHYAVLGVGLLGLAILLAPRLAGPRRFPVDAHEARVKLRATIPPVVDQVWTESTSRAPSKAFHSASESEDYVNAIYALKPQTELQRQLRERVLQTTLDIGKARLTLFSQMNNLLPPPLLVVLAFWFAVLFAAYSMYAEINAVSIVALMICAASVAAADVAAGAAIAVRRAVPRRVVEPTFAHARSLDARDGPLELLLSLGAPPDVPEPRRLRLGDLQRVVEELAPPAQEHRPARAPRLLEAEDLRGEADGFLGRRSEDLDVGELGEQTLGHE